MPLRGAPLQGAGARPFGARWAGPPLLFLGWKYWKSSQEKVSQKTTLYFSGKIRFFLILPITTLWFVSRTTDLLERIREQFFIQNWLEIVMVMTFFSTLHFIWFLPIFQFFAYALPNRIWQALFFYFMWFLWQARHATSITRHSRKTIAFPLKRQVLSSCARGVPPCLLWRVQNRHGHICTYVNLLTFLYEAPYLTRTIDDASSIQDICRIYRK